MNERLKIETSDISVIVARKGAEMTSLRDASGTELLWQAGPEWPRHAPVLFPIVGRLPNDTLKHRGESYEMTQHGFARDMTFDIVDASADRAKLRLRDNDLTHARFPFIFALDLIYALSGRTLTVTTRVENPGDEAFSFGVGAHPAFRWPLVEGIAKTDHQILFDTAETGHAHGVEAGFLTEPKPLPFDGKTLGLDEGLFADDAIVLPDLASRAVTYVARGPDGTIARELRVEFEGYKDLGIWSKPSGADFVCIEPWVSMASPLGWDGEFADKPGLLTLQPGESRDFVWRVTV